MSPIRLTLPAFPAVSPAELETWLRIDAGSDPAAVDLLVGSATEMVEGLTSLTLGLADYRVDLAGLEYCYKLPLSPIVSITSVEYRDATGTMVALTDWTLDHGYPHFETLPAGFPVITLKAGYPAASAIPDGLRHAIAVLVSAGYNDRETLPDATMKAVERLCARHRRIIW
jgi:uncharacterized phiE125 gp8 family phage protein